MTILWIMLGILMVLLFLEVPFFAAFTLVTIMGMMLAGIPLGRIPLLSFTALNSFPLAAVPFFILAGDIMTQGGLSQKIVEFITSIFGGVKGVLGHCLIIAATFFGAISGSAVATSAAMGSVMIPQMTEAGYDRRYSAALTAAVGVLGILIPPSIPMIIYGAMMNVSIAKCFLAGAVPGLMLAVGYMITNHFMCLRMKGLKDARTALPRRQRIGNIFQYRSQSRSCLVHACSDSWWHLRRGLYAD